MRYLFPIVLVLAACGERAEPPSAEAPDLILLNARVVTMDDADTVAEAVAVTPAETES